MVELAGMAFGELPRDCGGELNHRGGVQVKGMLGRFPIPIVLSVLSACRISGLYDVVRQTGASIPASWPCRLMHVRHVWYIHATCRSDISAFDAEYNAVR